MSRAESRCRDSFHADEDGGVKLHFLFMRFHGLLLVVPRLCVCARLIATATWGWHTHIALSWHQIILRSKNRGRACLWGLEVQVCMVAHTHAMKTFMQEEEVKQDWGGRRVCNPPPTMYDPFVFCERRGKKKNVCLMTTVNCAVLLWVQHPHCQLTCCWLPASHSNDFLVMHNQGRDPASCKVLLLCVSVWETPPPFRQK